MPQTSLTAKLLSLRPRFSLRTFLLLVLLLGCGFGGFTRWYQTVRQSGNAQLRLVQDISPFPFEPSPLEAQYPSQQSPSWFTSLVRKWVHTEYNRPFEHVTLPSHLIDTARARDVKIAFGVKSLYIQGGPIIPNNAALLFQARGLHLLSISGSGNWPEDTLLQLKHARQLRKFSTGLILSDPVSLELSKLPDLTEIRLTASRPEAIPILASAKKLEKLEIMALRHSQVDFRAPGESVTEFSQRSRRATQKALPLLAKNPNFSYLSIDGPLGLSREDLAPFCRASKLKTLHLHSPELDPECLEEIAKLESLETLTLYDLPILNHHLAPLTKAKNLKQLTIGPNISAQSIRELRKQLPGCKIERF
jgi:hypothetical protein